MRGPIRKGVIHMHSRYSYDSASGIAAIAKAALKRQLDFLVLTDHDTVKGSLALRDYCTRRGIDLEVPVAAEYNTSHGDVIAAFLEGEGEIVARNFSDFVAEVRSRKGLLLLPHPYHAHNEIEMLAKSMDLIETFNGRQSSILNERAANLALMSGISSYPGADAHIVSNIDAAIVTVEGKLPLKEALLNSGAKLDFSSPNAKADIFWSQLVKSAKTHNPKLLAYLLLRHPYRKFIKPLKR